MTRKEHKIVPILIVLTLLCLCVFNVSYSYFSATARIEGNAKFGEVKLTWMKYLSADYGEELEVSQLYPTQALSRNGVSAIKLSPSDKNPLVSLGLKNLSDEAYARFWIEVYVVQQIGGKYYYIDSKGNFVDDDGKYVDASGAMLNSASVDRGVVVDYAKYFQLGKLNGENFTAYDAGKTIHSGNNVTYFVGSKLGKSDFLSLNINAIKMLDTAPDALLSSNVCVNLVYEAVQAANGAYVEVFNDDRGFIDWENRVE